MSAPTTKQRKENDFYPTPSELAEAIGRLLKETLHLEPAFIVEPSAGTGSFVKVARKLWPQATIGAVDISPHFKMPLIEAGADRIVFDDWKNVAAGGFPPNTLIIGNPPYSLAEKHLTAGLNGLPDGSHQAALLRTGFIGSKKRVPFWRNYPLKILIPLVPRPSFTGGGSDYSEYSLFVWQKGHQGAATILPHLIWKTDD